MDDVDHSVDPYYETEIEQYDKQAEQKTIEVSLFCPYCASKAELVEDSVIYNGNSYDKRIWICSDYPVCDSYVGCHADGLPLGTLANKELRYWRRQAHEHFDPLWKFKNAQKSGNHRSDAYKWLSVALEIPKDNTHIAEMDVNQCKKIVELVQPYYKHHQIRKVYATGYKKPFLPNAQCFNIENDMVDGRT